ncbi:MAG TPA: SMC-Scp complex subunit ScpB [Chitinispirillaceae bacterium]|nr:SMC-Scp complex subunit ScpB [Chitinispirillaceae bacterium]
MNTMDNEEVMEIDENLDPESKQVSGTDVAADTIRILEALLFASDELLSAARIKAILPDNPDARQIRKMVDKINVQLQKERHPFEIVEIGGGYQFRTVAYYHPWVRQIFKEKAAKKLSLQALECLAVIAYKQPVSKAEIEAVRGVVSDGAMKTLLEKKLVTISGRSDKPGKPLQYSTTHEFLKYFGINKIDDLPRIEEFEAIAREKIEDLSFEELTGERVEQDESTTDSEEQQNQNELNQTPESTAVLEANKYSDCAQTESDSNNTLQKELPEQNFENDESDADPQSFSEFQEPDDSLENQPVPAPEPTAVFEVNGLTDSESADSLDNNQSQGQDEFEQKDSYADSDSDIQSQKKADMMQSQVADQDMDETEIVEMDIGERAESNNSKDTTLKNCGQSDEKNEESELINIADSESDDKKSQNVKSDLKTQQPEELLEVFIPENPVTESENEKAVQQKKNFFSKILKKKNQESEE